MASSSSRAPERAVHQDYICRIRYSNALPPPPNPPKLLNIPNTGLGSGQYTAPSYASRLAKIQPLNIEADAELGMPLDLVGIPGVMDGDERAIQAPTQQPPIHPHDRALLRPLSTLGKARLGDSSSFLLGANAGTKSKFDPSISKRSLAKRSDPLSAPPTGGDQNSDENILAAVERSFDIAAAYIQNPKRMRHPTRRNLQLVSSYPVIPDLEANTDFGGFVSIKFQNNPVPPSNVYDTRLECGMLRMTEQSPAQQEAHDAAMALYERDPARNPKPAPARDYEFLLPETAEVAARFKRKAAGQSTEDDQEPLRYKRQRAYETSKEENWAGFEKWNNEVVIAISDGSDGRQTAWAYPLILKSVIQTQRSKNIDRNKYGMGEEDEEDKVDELLVSVRAEDEDEKAARLRFKVRPMEALEDENEEKEKNSAAQKNEHDDAEPVGQNGDAPNDGDAEGDDE